MRKLVFVLLIIAAFAADVFSQTAMVLQMSVRRIPVTHITGGRCTDQRVLFFSHRDVMGILTVSDTLQLRKKITLISEPGHSIILCYDELHGNQPYRVRFIEGTQGIMLYIQPYTPRRENEVRAFQSVRVTPSKNRILYGLVISTIPCN